MNREQKLEDALRDVLEWIDNWGPEFTEAHGWDETRIRADEALEDDN